MSPPIANQSRLRQKEVAAHVADFGCMSKLAWLTALVLAGPWLCVFTYSCPKAAEASVPAKLGHMWLLQPADSHTLMP